MALFVQYTKKVSSKGVGQTKVLRIFIHPLPCGFLPSSCYPVGHSRIFLPCCIGSNWAIRRTPRPFALRSSPHAEPPAHERVIRTLRAWNIRIDEALFLGGMDKGAFLKAFGADIFFDDQQKHCESARQHVATGHVPHGVANERDIA
jgi:hypothetical protein